MRSYIKSALLAVLLAWVPGRAVSQVVPSIDSLTITNPVNDLIASDALNGNDGYDRDAIKVASVVDFNHTANSFDFELRYELIDDAGDAVNLRVGGATVPRVTVARNAVNADAFNVAGSVSLTPAVLLAPGREYRVRLTCWRRVTGGGAFADTLVTATSLPRVWRHFMSTNSADSSFNVVPTMEAVTWSQVWAAASTADRDKFLVNAEWRADRYDGYLADPTDGENITFRLNVELREEGSVTPVVLEQSSFTMVVPMASHEFPAEGPRIPKKYETITQLAIRPAVILKSAGKRYHVKVTIGHVTSPGAGLPVAANSVELLPQRLLHFSGVMRFGAFAGFFDEVVFPGPVAGALTGSGIAATGLRVSGQSGVLTGLGGFTWGNGSALNVVLEDDGDALLSAGTVPVTEPLGVYGTSGGMRFERRNLVMSPSGATADVALVLPSGLGVTTNVDPGATRIWDSEIVFTGTGMAAGYMPVGPGLFRVTNFWVCEESKPVWMQASRVDWVVGQPRLTFTSTETAGYVRRAETDALLADAEVAIGERFKRGNDMVFWKTSKVTGNVVIDADAAGTAKLTVQLGIAGGYARTHFPYDSAVRFNSAVMRIVGDAVDTAQSVMTGLQDIQVPYAQDCGGEDCPTADLPAALLVFDAGAGQPLRFTADGGVQAAGTLAANAKLQWGRIAALGKFAHETSEFSQSGLHFPGCFMNGGGAVSGAKGPGWMLHSGFNRATGTMVRPGTTAFEEGTGDYAGLNFRTSGGSFTGRSVLAGVSTGSYDLSHRCQYVTRRAGVSGIHEAYTGSFPPGAELGGYPLLFDDFGIQLRYSRVTDSRTKGSLEVPEPSGFSLEFEKLFFTCLGAPSGMELSPAAVAEDRTLAYWQADFRIRQAAFLPMADGACDPTEIRLSATVEAWSSEIAEPLHGTLGFLPSGQLQTGENEATDPPVVSRLKLPPNLDMAGPGEERWTATTVGDAYFNHAAAAPGEVGWLNIAAKLNLPFFEDAPVHLQTGAKKNDAGAVLHLMGGFQDKAKCFTIGQEHYFTQQPFDVGHRGYATGVTVAQYREGFTGDDDRFRMHAQTRWLDVVDLDYPMMWKAGSRSFKDFKEKTSSLLVLSVQHRCRTLTAENADLDFGAKAGLNKLSLTSLASDQVSELLGTLDKLINENVLMAGREAIEELLEPTMRRLFAVPLDAKMDAQAEELLVELFSDQYWDPGTKTFKQGVDKAVIAGLLAEGKTGLLKGFKDVAGTGTGVLGLLKEVKLRIESARDHIIEFRKYSAPGVGNKFESIATTAKRMAAKVSKKLEDPVYAEDIDALIAAARPVLAELDVLAEKAEKVCVALLNGLEGNGALATEIKSVLAGAGVELEGAVGQVAGDVSSLLKPYKAGLDMPSHPEEVDKLRRKIREAMADRFFSTGISASVQKILKQRLYDVEQQMRQVMDGVFEQADTAARELIATVLGGVDEKLTEFMGGAAKVMAGAELKGKAHIRGDSLTDLRLDLKVEFKAAEAMKAHVFLEIRELNSENTPGGCLPKGETGTEVTLGAKEVSLEWAYPGLTVGFDTRFQFAGDGTLTGLGGSIEILGEIKFGDQFIITEMGCAMMFGQDENYFSAEVAMQVGKGFKAKGGVFFGKTCSLAPFFWDQSIKEALGEAPFTGAYVYGEVHMALNQLIGIPSTCLFNLSVGAGTGIGYFTEGPTWIGKMYLSVEGEVLCIVSVTGEISLVGVKNPQGLNLVGKGRLAAELGWCPLCISVEKTATLTYKNRKWSKKVE